MPWQDKAVQFSPVEVITVVEDKMIFNERDAEGNQIPPGAEPPPEEPPVEEPVAEENQQ